MEHETSTERRPTIYVASLSDYNAGRLHGCWLDAARAADDIRADVAAMLARSPEPIAEEWSIHDYEGFEGVTVGEFEGIETVAEAACLIVEHGPVFGGLLDHFGGLSEIEEAKRCMADGYRGEFDSLRDYVEEFLDECYADVLAGLPDFIRGHIDVDGIARDFEIAGDVFTVEVGGRVHVFDANC